MINALTLNLDEDVDVDLVPDLLRLMQWCLYHIGVDLADHLLIYSPKYK